MSASSTRLLAALVVVVTFFVGAVVGAFAVHAWLLRGGLPQHSAQFITRRLDRRLHFNDQQRLQVIEIVDRHERRIAIIWTNVRPAVHQEIEAANVEIDHVLTPEQRVVFGQIRMRLMPRQGDDGIRFKHE
ncbi:MAG TPA: hypothetical protein VF505_03090 [Thermoanaerobaculia bacterium]